MSFHQKKPEAFLPLVEDLEGSVLGGALQNVLHFHENTVCKNIVRHFDLQHNRDKKKTSKDNVYGFPTKRCIFFILAMALQTPQGKS